MTERELDRIMRRVLIDSLKMDDEKAEKDQGPPFEPTSSYKRRMRAMLADPLSWLHRQGHPRWKQIARRAAIILIACVVTIGGIMAISPTARAAVVRWAVELYENNIAYRYRGEQNAEALPQYEITELPDGYVETMRNISPGLVSVTYEDQFGDVIYLDYVFMYQGTQTNFVINEDSVLNVMVNQMNGQFIESQIPENLNTLTWINPDLNIHFTIDGYFNLDTILHMAESVSLCKTPKNENFVK